MKKTFFKYLPVAAAILLATSCSKDSDNGPTTDIVEQPSTSEPVSEQPTPDAPKTVKVPFSVKVDNGTSLSKITYEVAKDDKGEKIWNKVSRKFTDDEATDGSAIELSVRSYYADAVESATLTLTKDVEGNFVFAGDIEVSSDSLSDFNSGEIYLIGTFGTAAMEKDAVVANKISLADLMKDPSVPHQYKAVFKSNAESISLYDQNAYIAIQMSTDQHKLMVNSAWRELNDDGQVWIAVGAGTPITTNFLTREADDVQAGHIYTINRAGYVDVGISDGTLWADANVTSGTGTAVHEGIAKLYTYAQAEALGVTLPTRTDITNLINQCNHEENFQMGDRYGLLFYPKSVSTYDESTTPHIFIPAEGFVWDPSHGSGHSSSDWNILVSYWGEQDAEGCPRLNYKDRNAHVDLNCSNLSGDYGSSVRAVLHSN